MFENLAGLHPMIVHFPIVLFVSYFLVEVSNLFFKQSIVDAVNFIILLAGVLFSVVAVLTGNQAYNAALHILQSKPAEIVKVLELHETMATISLWLFTAILFLRYYLFSKNKLTQKWKILISIIAFFGVIFIYQTAFLGGKLVFDFGVGTKFFTK
ncbi:DUF2231 domain-containing protein [Stygiobacter electus]|uniref:DUF2231 domain-containing protein n=1 Tax=Stygiobacter electus TaxID=3032292 RepID=A0AAE3P113_9BACT|nr:DUF2231 domain-containing protein [Stygiobacter electus]MDF1610840.1 DUF2231 domain-containing protein [Stygiobacter electus]